MADRHAGTADRRPPHESVWRRCVLRLLALVGKELVEVIRRPGALVSLVLGPFLIMAVFGLGYNGVRRPLETVVVIPPRRACRPTSRPTRSSPGAGCTSSAVDPTRPRPRPGLADGRSTSSSSPRPTRRRSSGPAKQSVIEVVVNTVDPLRANYAGFLAANLANAVNQTIIRRAVEEAEGYVAAAEPERAGHPAGGRRRPDQGRGPNTSPSEPQVLAYFGPAVLALILQHLAVTLVALALVRERTSGVIELFRVAPVNAWEVIAGKVLGLPADRRAHRRR